MNIGISVTRNQLHAVVPDPNASFHPTVISVPCVEPFELKEEAIALYNRLREIIPDDALPGAVLTLPPEITYLRPLKLPVTDLRRARLIHLSELEGTLPIEDEEILSDLLPSSPATPDVFMAVAAKRSLVEKTVDTFNEAGIRVDMVVTDHAALLAAVSGNIPEDALLISAFSDILLLRISGGGVCAARQLPAAMADIPSEIMSAIDDLTQDKGLAVELVAAGDLPASIAKILSAPTELLLPEGIPSSHLAAFGAALAPESPKALGGFSLRTSAEIAAEKAREMRKIRIAATAVAVATVIAIAALLFSVWINGKKLAKVRSQIRVEFSQAAPDVILRDATMESQIREKIASLKRLQAELGVNASSPADLLALASSALPKGDIAVREASVEGGRVRLAGETGDSRLIEQYREELSRSFGPGYTSTLQGTEASVKGGVVKFTILIEQKEEPRVS